MSKEKINLEKLFNNNFDCYTQVLSKFVEQEEESALTKDKFKELCLDFGKQLLTLAAENAKTIKDYDFDDNPIVDKQSILDTIKQIEL